MLFSHGSIWDMLDIAKRLVVLVGISVIPAVEGLFLASAVLIQCV
jgi:hypothetical protein